MTEGLPDASRFIAPGDLQSGQTPFDNLDRDELLRVIQAYHLALVLVSGVLDGFRWYQKDTALWRPKGDGFKAWEQAQALLDLSRRPRLDKSSVEVNPSDPLERR